MRIKRAEYDLAQGDQTAVSSARETWSAYGRPRSATKCARHSVLGCADRGRRFSVALRECPAGARARAFTRPFTQTELRPITELGMRLTSAQRPRSADRVPPRADLTDT